MQDFDPSQYAEAAPSGEPDRLGYLDNLESRQLCRWLLPLRLPHVKGSNLAVIAAANGLTGDPKEGSYAYSPALTSSASGCPLVVIRTADLLSLTSAQDLIEMLRRRWLEAWANGGMGAG